MRGRSVRLSIGKGLSDAGRRKELYYFRDQQGLEVDFILPVGDRHLRLIDAKASRTVTPGMAEPLVRLSRAISGYPTSSFLVHRKSKENAVTFALRPGVTGLSVDRLHSVLTAP